MGPGWRASSRGPASMSSRSTAPTARPGATRASPTLSTPSRRPAPSSRAGPRGKPRAVTDRSRRSGRYSWRSSSARAGRIKAIGQIRHLSFTGPDDLRGRLKNCSSATLPAEAARLRARRGDPASFGTKVALATLGRRVLALEAEIAHLDELLAELVTDVAPELLGIFGIGIDTAAVLLATAGDNAQRVRSEAAFARLCGVAPLPASSGKTTGRHRLNQGGDRQANQALWRIVLTRMAFDLRTRAYVDRRTKEGLSKREVIRALKRYVAREVYRHLPRP